MFKTIKHPIACPAPSYLLGIGKMLTLSSDSLRVSRVLVCCCHGHRLE